MEPTERKAAYLKIRDGVIASQQPHASAYLAAFDAFIVEWLDLEPIGGSLFAGIVDPPPRANIVWPHEWNHVGEWAANTALDPRLSLNWQFAWHVSDADRIRIWELLTISKKSMKLHPGAVEIEIAPLPRYGRLKSPSARRTIIVTKTESLRFLSEFFERRSAEGALHDDLLLGDPHRPGKVYKLGNFCVGFNRMLKTVTGDPAISFHTLSHTRISAASNAALLQEIPSEVNPMDEVAVHAAHRSYATSHTYYSHWYEDVLRRQIDIGLSRNPLPSHIASRWCGQSAAMIRKNAAKYQMHSSKFGWKLILTMPEKVSLPTAAAGYSFEAASPPDPAGVDSLVNFGQILWLMCDLTAGLKVDSIAARCNCEPTSVEAVAKCAYSILRGLRGYRPPALIANLRPGRISLADALVALQRLNADAHTKIDFTRIDQAKLATLRQLLSSMDAADVHSIGERWFGCYCAGYLSLDDNMQTESLLALLAKARIRAVHIGIAIADADRLWTDSARTAAIERIEGAFVRRFSVKPIRFSVKRRRGRPKTYLLLASCVFQANWTPIPRQTGQ
jgi:hypothetical protein